MSTEMTVDSILSAVSEERAPVFRQLHETILAHLPEGFEAAISYGGLGYVVPHALYSAGYHCKPSEPLPFAGIASQKQSINLYHMGIYADPVLMDWFVGEFPKHSARKLDMGKSCIRFKKPEDVPLALIGELMEKITVADWIARYEAAFLPKKKR